MITYIKNIRSKFLLALLFVVGNVAFAAADNKMWIEDFGISVGETKTVEVLLNNDGVALSAQVFVTLPAGLSYVEESEAVSSRTEDFTVAHNTVSGVERFTIVGSSDPISGNEGVLFTFQVTASNALAATSSISMTNMFYSQSTGGLPVSVKLNDQTVTVTREAKLDGTAEFSAVESFDINPNETMTVDVNLDNTAKVVAFQGYLTLPEGLTLTSMTKSSRISSWVIQKSDKGDGVIFFTGTSMSNTAVKGESGALFSFTVEANQTLKDGSKIVIDRINISNPSADSFDRDDVITITVGNPNERALEPAKTKLAELQALFAAAKDEVAETYPTVKDAEPVAAAAQAVNSKLEALATSIDDNYAAGTLASLDVDAAAEEVQTLVAAYKVAAKQAENDAAFAALSAKVAELQTAFDAAKAVIADYAVADRFAEKLEAIQTKISADLSAISAKNEAVELTTADVVADYDDIKAEIEAVAAEAKAAEEAFLANEAAHTALSAQIAAVQAEYDEAAATIKGYDVADEFAEQLAAVQTKIDEVRQAVEADYEAEKLTAESSVDAEVADIKAAIAEVAAAAKAEQEKFAANEAAHTALSAQIAELQAAYDEAAATIKGYDVADEFAEQLAAIQTMIDEAKTAVEAAYAERALTAESTVENAADIEAAIAEVAAAKAEQEKFAANEAAHTALTAQIADLQAAYDEAAATIKGYDVADEFAEHLAAIQTMIDEAKAAVEAAYAERALTAESTVETAGDIETLIAGVAADAKAEQERYAANEAAYKDLTAQLESLQEAYDKAVKQIDRYDVAAQFDEAIDNIQAQIKELKTNIEAAHNARILNKDEAAGFADAISTVAQAIEDVKAEAAAAQQAYEEEQAKKAANEAAYTKLNNQIDQVESLLKSVKATILTTCPDVDYTEKYAELQAQIDALRDQVKQAYEAVELTAETTVDTQSIEDAINALAAQAPKDQKAIEEQRAAEEAAAKKAANDEAYAALTAQVDALQAQLDEVKAAVADYDESVSEQFAEQLEALQGQIDAARAELEAANEAIELTAESTVKDADAIKAAIEKVAADAAAAQQAYEEQKAAEEAEAAKKAANEKAYTELSAQVQALQAQLDAATNKINGYDKYVSNQFVDAIGDLQEQINALQEQLEADYEAVKLTADSQLEGVADMEAAIANLLTSAAQAQKDYDEWKANEAAQVNEAQYEALKARLDEVQKQYYDMLIDVYNNCQDVVNDYTDELADLQKQINTIAEQLEAKHDAIQLTADNDLGIEALANAISQLQDELKAAQAEFVYTHIGTVRMVEGAVEYYNTNGVRVSTPQKGSVMVVKMADGTVKKIKM